MLDHDVHKKHQAQVHASTTADKLKVGAVSVAVCAGLGLGVVSVYPPQFASADTVAQPAATKALSEIEIPAYTGIYARDFWNHGGDAIKKDAIIAYAKEVLKPLGVSDHVQYSVTDEDFKKAIAETGGYFREAASSEITLTLTEGATTKTTKIKTIFFQPPYVQRTGVKKDGDPKPRSFEGSHTSHNQGKLNVVDPDNYTLTPVQKTKLIDDFKNANKKLALPDTATYEMDEIGNLTISYEQDGKKLSTTISRDYFISDVAFVPDILVFHKPDGTNAKSEPLKDPLFIKLRKDKEYKNFWTGNGTGIGNAARGWAKDFKVEKIEDAEGKRLKITGAYTKLGATPSQSRGRYEKWGKYGIGVAPENTDRGYKQSFTNIFRVRVLRVHDTTYIRCVDEEAKERYDFDKDIKEKLGVNWDELKAYNGPDDAPGTSDDAVRNQVKPRVDVAVDDTNPTFEHKAGVQVFKGHAVLKDQGNQASPTSTATRIYYTKHIPVTVVADQSRLTEDEKKIIIDKVKKANGFDENKNPFEVSVAEDGRITIKYNVKHTDKNGNQKDTFTADLGRPVQQFQFKDSEVKAGGTVNVPKPAEKTDDGSGIKKDDHGNPIVVPDGTTYKAPGEDPDTPGTKQPFTIDVAHGDGKVVVTVTPKDDGTFDIKVPEDTEPDITLDVPINVCLPTQKCAVITAKVHVLKPDNKLFEPKGGAIERKFGEGTSKEDIFSKVEVKSEKDGKFDENGTTPKDNEMPTLSVDESKIPTGEESGKFEVEVTATYPDGTKDKTTVTVTVGPEAPVVEAKDDGSVDVKLPEDPGADKVVITYKKDGADKTITLTKEGGAWKLPDGTEGVTLENGVVTISADEVDDDTEVSATSTNTTIQQTSDVSKDTAKKKPSTGGTGGVPVPDPQDPTPVPNPNGNGNNPSGNADNPSGNAGGNTGSNSGEGSSSNASSTNQNSGKKPAGSRKRAMRKVPQTNDLFGLSVLGEVAALGGALFAGLGVHKKHEEK